MLSFQDIMQKYWDATHANKREVEEEIVNTTANIPTEPVVRKKKKKPLYDGRTKQGKKFVERMNGRAKRREESKIARQVKENTEDFGVEYLLEDNLDVLKNIVKKKQHNKINLKDGTLKVDLFTASAIMGVLDNVSKPVQQKITKMINTGSKNDFMKLQSLAMKAVK
tara:strand:- start:1757 stop:2257 length:501 start_codon:yes stop_codon:yes gene_type:complete